MSLLHSGSAEFVWAIPFSSPLLEKAVYPLHKTLRAFDGLRASALTGNLVRSNHSFRDSNAFA